MILFAVSLFPMLLLLTRADCPVDLPCRCSSKEITCSAQGLTLVPIFRASTSSYNSIDLSHNNISRIEDNAFSNINFGDDVRLDLTFNNIDFIGESAFSWFENARTTVYLDHNKLENLPRALLQLTNMYDLHISYAKTLDSEILKHIGRTLKYFHIDLTDLTTRWFPEMQYLTALSSIVIHNGRFETFSGRLPDSLKDLLFIRSVIMGNLTLLCNGNSLQGLRFIDTDFSKASMTLCRTPLPGVKTLTIDRSPGWGKFPMDTLLTNYPNVSTMSLAYNNISELNIEWASENTHIQFMALSGNRLTQVPKGLHQMKALKDLRLDGNNISAIKDDDFANLTNLVRLHLSHNPISFVANASIKGCTNLSDLVLDFGLLTSVPGTLKYLRNLHYLGLTNNNISALNEMDFNNNPRLEYLHLSHNPIAFVHKNTFDGCPNLRSLQLSSALLKTIPDAIIPLTQLQDINLSNNLISTIKDDDFKYKFKLSGLSLDNNPLSSISRNAFKGSPNLQLLRLRHTLLTTVPRAVSNIQVLTNVFLDNSRVRCDCDLAWILKETFHIYGYCTGSTTSILNFIQNNIKSCPGGTIIG